MAKCKQCKVEVISTEDKCPLCQTPIIGKMDPIFPSIAPDIRNHNLIFKIISILGLFASGVCLIINLVFKTKVFFSLYVFLSFLYLIGFLYITIKKRENPCRVIINLVTITIFFIVSFDLLTGWHSWSINFVIPIVLSVSVITMGIMSLAGNLLVEDFLGYFLLTILYGMIPLVLILTGLVSIVVPSFICIIISFFFLLFLAIFEGRNMKTELKRRLHL